MAVAIGAGAAVDSPRLSPKLTATISDSVQLVRMVLREVERSSGKAGVDRKLLKPRLLIGGGDEACQRVAASVCHSMALGCNGGQPLQSSEVARRLRKELDECYSDLLNAPNRGRKTEAMEKQCPASPTCC